MGKSSLMARTAAHLRSEGSAIAIVDLTGITEAKNPDATLWYRGVCRRIAQDVGLLSGFDRWWKLHQELTQVQRFSEFLETFVLGQIGAARLIIFVDEIDATLRLDFSDDFFAAIRACYNARATSSQFERLTFALLGVASPSDLIKDSSRTPFNIGQRIHLDDFTSKEAVTLTAGFDCDEVTALRILNRVLYWTDGQPYLTQRVCLELGGNGAVIVHSDADLDHAAERCALGGFVRAGQACISVQRVFVAADVAAAFEEKFVSRVSALKLGDPLDDDTAIGVLVDEGTTEKALALIADARASGATVVCGGGRRGPFVEPTLLRGASERARVSQVEDTGQSRGYVDEASQYVTPHRTSNNLGRSAPPCCTPVSDR